jgi:hypothetical protein
LYQITRFLRHSQKPSAGAPERKDSKVVKRRARGKYAAALAEDTDTISAHAPHLAQANKSLPAVTFSQGITHPSNLWRLPFMTSKYWSFSYVERKSKAPKKNFDWSKIDLVGYAAMRVDDNAFKPGYVVVSGYIETTRPCRESAFSELLPEETNFTVLYEPLEPHREEILKRHILRDTVGPWEYGHWVDFEKKGDLERLEVLLNLGLGERRIHNMYFPLWTKYRDVIKASLEIREENRNVAMNGLNSLKRNLAEAADTQ